MACDVNTLLASGKCFAALPASVLKAIQVQLWCDIAGGVVPPVITNPPLLSDNGEWFIVSAVDLGGGDATVSVDQLAVPPGTHPYLVLQRPTDGLLYKFGINGAPPNVFWFVDDTPLAEAETLTVLTDGVTNWDLIIGADFNARLVTI